MNDTHSIEFQPSGRGKAQCPSNPEYPNGIALNMTKGEEAGCMVEIPYPAPECGLYVIQCKLCDTSVAVTAAGRADDPNSIKMRCRIFAATEETETRLRFTEALDKLEREPIAPPKAAPEE